MQKSRIVMFLLVFLFSLSTAAFAQQYPVIDSAQVKSLVQGKKALLVDARPPEEYQQAHIPGAINIPADQIKAEAARLPKNKKKTIVFYCRGAG